MPPEIPLTSPTKTLHYIDHGAQIQGCNFHWPVLLRMAEFSLKELT